MKWTPSAPASSRRVGLRRLRHDIRRHRRCILLGVINQGMSIYGLDDNWQYVVKGVVLLIAVIFDVVSNKKTGKAG
jgi:hypothetical protein